MDYQLAAGHSPWIKLISPKAGLPKGSLDFDKYNGVMKRWKGYQARP